MKVDTHPRFFSRTIRSIVALSLALSGACSSAPSAQSVKSIAQEGSPCVGLAEAMYPQVRKAMDETGNDISSLEAWEPTQDAIFKALQNNWSNDGFDGDVITGSERFVANDGVAKALRGYLKAIGRENVPEEGDVGLMLLPDTSLFDKDVSERRHGLLVRLTLGDEQVIYTQIVTPRDRSADLNSGDNANNETDSEVNNVEWAVLDAVQGDAVDGVRAVQLSSCSSQGRFTGTVDSKAGEALGTSVTSLHKTATLGADQTLGFLVGSPLTSLTVKSSALDDDDLVAFGRFSFANLKKVDLKGASVSHVGVNALLVSQTHIQQLVLTDTLVEDSVFESLATLTGLRRVLLGGTKVTKGGVETFLRDNKPTGLVSVEVPAGLFTTEEITVLKTETDTRGLRAARQ